MADFTGAAIPDNQTPYRVGHLTTAFVNVIPTQLGLSAGSISVNDTIELMELPKGYRPTSASIRPKGAIADGGSAPTVKLQAVRNGSASDLTAATTVSAAHGGVRMNVAALGADNDYTTHLRLLVAGGGIDRTISDPASGIDVMVQYEADDAP